MSARSKNLEPHLRRSYGQSSKGERQYVYPSEHIYQLNRLHWILPDGLKKMDKHLSDNWAQKAQFPQFSLDVKIHVRAFKTKCLLVDRFSFFFLNNPHRKAKKKSLCSDFSISQLWPSRAQKVRDIRAVFREDMANNKVAKLSANTELVAGTSPYDYEMLWKSIQA